MVKINVEIGNKGKISSSRIDFLIRFLSVNNLPTGQVLRVNRQANGGAVNAAVVVESVNAPSGPQVKNTNPPFSCHPQILAGHNNGAIGNKSKRLTI